MWICPILVDHGTDYQSHSGTNSNYIISSDKAWAHAAFLVFTLHNMSVQNTGSVQYIRGYSVHWGISLNTLGVCSTLGGNHEYSEGYHDERGGIS